MCARSAGSGSSVAAAAPDPVTFSQLPARVARWSHGFGEKRDPTGDTLKLGSVRGRRRSGRRGTPVPTSGPAVAGRPQGMDFLVSAERRQLCAVVPNCASDQSGHASLAERADRNAVTDTRRSVADQFRGGGASGLQAWLHYRYAGVDRRLGAALPWGRGRLRGRVHGARQAPGRAHDHQPGARGGSGSDATRSRTRSRSAPRRVVRCLMSGDDYPFPWYTGVAVVEGRIVPGRGHARHESTALDEQFEIKGDLAAAVDAIEALSERAANSSARRGSWRQPIDSRRSSGDRRRASRCSRSPERIALARTCSPEVRADFRVRGRAPPGHPVVRASGS
jgi:hypothetical protein